MNLELNSRAMTADGRSVAALRGSTRQNLDRLIMDYGPNGLGGTGIGRSAFIQAAIDLVIGLADETDENGDLDVDENGESMFDRFTRVAKMYEAELPR